MAAEPLVVAALSRHASRQQPVAFPRIPPGLNLVLFQEFELSCLRKTVGS